MIDLSLTLKEKPGYLYATVIGNNTCDNKGGVDMRLFKTVEIAQHWLEENN